MSLAALGAEGAAHLSPTSGEWLSVVSVFFSKGSQSQAEVGRTSFRIQTSPGSDHATLEKAKDQRF